MAEEFGDDVFEDRDDDCDALLVETVQAGVFEDMESGNHLVSFEVPGLDFCFVCSVVVAEQFFKDLRLAIKYSRKKNRRRSILGSGENGES